MNNRMIKGNKFIDTKLLMSKLSLNGYTKTSFAEACSVSRGTITNIFNKDIRVDNTLMSKMYEVLKLDEKDAFDIFFTPNLRIAKVLESKQLLTKV